MADFDINVRLQLFHEFVRTGRAPGSREIAGKMGASESDVRAALERLAAAKTIVLQPDSREILMANPLCAVPTAFRTRIGDRSYFGSCVWDALGIAAMLERDATVDTSCAYCGEAMSLEVRGGRISSARGVIHFAIPAKRWWENIVFT